MSLPVADSQHAARCPVCRQVLHPFTHAGVTVDACLECRGVWFDAGELDRLLGAFSGLPLPPFGRLAAADGECPLGHGRMHVTPLDQGIVIDRCPNCSGIWLDGGEVAHMRRLFLSATPTAEARAQGLEFRIAEAQRAADEERINAQQEVELSGGQWLLQWFLQSEFELPREVYSPVRERPVATYTIIGACVLVFAAELYALQSVDAETLLNQWGLIPATFLRGGAPWTLITSMLLHGGIFHLLSNMYFLWVFGDNVEDHLGVGRYLALYLLGGVVGALAQIASDPRATDAMAGASGAISAVAGAYMYLFPDRRFYLMIFDILLRRVRAIWLLGIWLAFQLTLALLGVPGVAWWAHIGGFGFGVGAAALYRYNVARRIESLERSGE